MKAFKTPLIIVLALVFAATGGLAAHFLTDRTVGTPDTEAVILEQPRLIPDRILLDHHGSAWSPKRLEGQWTLIFFGFTHCPDICPETMVVINQAHRMIEENGKALPPSVVFISVDPARDTPERLANYVPYFNQSFLGVTGDQEDIEELASAMAVPLQIPDVDPDQDYEVDHGSQLILVGPDGHIRAFFTAPHHPRQIAQDYEAIVRYLNPS
ncbi:protein SCO1/2 [Natronospira proteinivora]|uniref:Protein SCO1/2 n=1 Tax=Natronospira proteinivora TaxID=1807133 RepID=A0ABT1G736_9GAMM|nr:SCO family protein [Natronospira proteinivora]MCP1727110.1 protein SCO1/2 [Natronospira proteinivora]